MQHATGNEAWRGWWQGPGGGAEVMRVAWPLILSNSFFTLQLMIDRVLLSRASSEMGAAAMPAALVFWTPMILLQFTANYATTFVAQYTGAGRPHRVGPAVWQALHFSVVAGLAFLLLLPLAGPLIALAGHAPELQELEATYFRCLCFCALPTLVTASAASFFNGLGHTRVVLWLNGVGLLVNAVLDYAWITGEWGFPAWGIAGAGWATACGCSASAVVGVGLMMRPRYRADYATASGWRPEAALLRRLLWFGLPNGLSTSLETLAFTVFVALVGWLGTVEMAATNIAFTLNLIVFLPMVGFGQAVGVLLGQRLGEDRPDLAERAVRSGLALALLLTGAAMLLYLALPGALVSLFEPRRPDDTWPAVEALVPVLLRFVVVYALFDSTNLVLSFALRGAGDTRFVSTVSVVLSWLILVVPTWAACRWGWPLTWAWGFVTAYVVLLSAVFLVRFRQGKWKAMRVIEPNVIEAGAAKSASSNGEPGALATGVVPSGR